MKKSIIVTISLLLNVVLFCSVTWFLFIHTRLMNPWESWQKSDPTVEEMRYYYKSLAVTKLTSKEVVCQMIEQKGLLHENDELIEMTDYYVYHGSKRVIRQLIDNLQNEVELRLPEETVNRSDVFTRDVIGKSYSILQNKLRLLPHVSPVLHDELFRFSTSKDKPHLIYLIMELISSNDCPIAKPDTDRDYTSGGGVYYDIDWYTEGLVERDVLAYIRIYVNYKEWPSLRSSIVSRFHHFPGEWLDSKIMRDVLSLADEKGVEHAYQVFLDRFQDKHRNK